MGAWKEIVDYTVPSTTTSVVLDNFGTITKDDFIKIHTTIGSSSFNNIRMTANNTVFSNYTSQRLTGDGSSVSAARFNSASNPQVNRTSGDTTSSAFNYLKLSQNDRVNYFSNMFQDNGSSVQVSMTYATSNGATFPNGITSLTFTGANTNINAGSRIQIYKLTAKKVADILVTSNTTQVDITGLDIKKGDEYLLVNDFQRINLAALYLGINGNTNLTSYWNQNIRGRGSAPSARRSNNNIINLASTDMRGLAYTHIKLSNIGAFTYQSYSILNYNFVSNLGVENWFGSSLAENINSITELNIYGDGVGVGATSRFELYKLYEGGN